MSTAGWGTLPFRAGALLTIIVVAPLAALHDSAVTCMPAGFAAMLVGVVAGLPVMLMMQRRLFERLIREGLRSDARRLP